MYSKNEKERVNSMRRSRRKSFDELVKENKQQLLSDRDAIDRIEERIEKRYEMKLLSKLNNS